jgi:hypothetical protein
MDEGARARAVAAASADRVNMRSLNIFNGLYRVPVKEKIPPLNSI